LPPYSWNLLSTKAVSTGSRALVTPPSWFDGALAVLRVPISLFTGCFCICSGMTSLITYFLL
jgi:hypothetical protein